jgi:ketosteroid isomerase-like protein
MSEENIEAVRRVYGEWAQGNFRAGPEIYDQDVVFVQSRELGTDSGTYLGLDGVRDYMGKFLEVWERVTVEASELIEAGDSVVVKVIQRAVGKGSGVEPAEMEYFHVWTFRGGKVIRLDVIRSREAALEAAGISD